MWLWPWLIMVFNSLIPPRYSHRRHRCTATCTTLWSMYPDALVAVAVPRLRPTYHICQIIQRSPNLFVGRRWPHSKPSWFPYIGYRKSAYISNLTQLDAVWAINDVSEVAPRKPPKRWDRVGFLQDWTENYPWLEWCSEGRGLCSSLRSLMVHSVRLDEALEMFFQAWLGFSIFQPSFLNVLKDNKCLFFWMKNWWVKQNSIVNKEKCRLEIHVPDICLAPKKLCFSTNQYKAHINQI